jgi:hypothetical protein
MSLDSVETRAALATASTRLGLAQILVSKIDVAARSGFGEQGLRNELTNLLSWYRAADEDFAKLARQAVAERARA